VIFAAGINSFPVPGRQGNCKMVNGGVTVKYK
jgi:hypothetical protein